jgi:hypothetical protein
MSRSPPCQQQDGAIDLDLFQRAIRSQMTRRPRYPLPATRKDLAEDLGWSPERAMTAVDVLCDLEDPR